MNKQDEAIAIELKNMIEREGKSYLTDEPYKVFNELVDNGVADRALASGILCVLVNNLQNAKIRENASEFSALIKKECGFNKNKSDHLAAIFGRLYSKGNRQAWRSRSKEGLKQFLKEEFNCEWEGYAVWNTGGGSVSCYYEAQITLQPLEAVSQEEGLERLLKKNAFLKKEAISDYFCKKLCGYLDRVFDDYCTCDDYYQPVVEDFGLDEYVSDWCKKNGFEVIACEGNGSDGGFEPDLRGRW